MMTLKTVCFLAVLGLCTVACTGLDAKSYAKFKMTRSISKAFMGCYDKTGLPKMIADNRDAYSCAILCHKKVSICYIRFDIKINFSRQLLDMLYMEDLPCGSHFVFSC